MISCQARMGTMDETWLCHYDPGTKPQSMEWQHSVSPLAAPKNSECKNPLESSRVDFFGIKKASPSLLISKGPNYQRGVLFISAGVIEGHFEGKRRWKVNKGVLFLQENVAAHRTLSTQKKLTYLGFQ